MPDILAVTARAAKAEADRLFSKVIRTRDGWRCRYCGSTSLGLTECAHIFSRRYNAGRTDEDNAVTLCRSCAQLFTEHPNDWKLWVISWMGAPAFNALSARVHEVTRVDWPRRADELTVRLTELQEEMTV